MKKFFQVSSFLRKHSEQVLWVVALLLLFFMNPALEHVSFCIFQLVGIDSCWGCGIGRAIHYALHLEFRQSIHQHFAGLPATVALLCLIFKPFFRIKNKTSAHEPTPDAYDVA